MSCGPRLQGLPPYVLQMVVWDMCDMNFRLAPGVDWEGPSYAALTPLLQTCRALRQPALLAIFHECDLCIEEDMSIKVGLVDGQMLVPASEFPTYAGYARRVTLTVDAAAIAASSARRLVDDTILGSMHFVAANRVDLRLHFESAVYANNHHVADNINDFLRRLGNLIPHASWVSAFIHQHGCYFERKHSGPLGALAQKMFGLSPEGGSLLPYRGPMLLASSLTQIGCIWDIDHPSMTHVIRHNADTLSSLEVLVGHNDNIQPLFATETGAGIIYPSLKQFRLRARGPHAPRTTTIRVWDTPFPGVENMWMDYFPFSNEAIFRSVRSLQGLSISLDAKTLGRLDMGRVLSKERLPSLRSAYILSVVDDDDNSAQLVDCYLQLTHNLMQFVSDVTIVDAEVATRLPEYLLGRPSATGVQSLCLKYCNLGLEHLLGLIQMLPSLQVLKCPVVQLGTHSRKVDSIALASKMRARFDMKHTRLRTWRIANDDVSPISTIALFMLVVADLCPKLGRIEFDNTCDVADTIFRVVQGSRLLASFEGRLALARVEGSLPPTIYIKRRLELSPV